MYSFGKFFILTLSIVSITVSSSQYKSATAQEYPGCFLRSSSGNLVDLNNFCQPMSIAPANNGAESVIPGSASSTQAGLPACIQQSDCDCSDFTSKAQAQQVLKAFPNDPFKLDNDKDGSACESLSK